MKRAIVVILGAVALTGCKENAQKQVTHKENAQEETTSNEKAQRQMTRDEFRNTVMGKDVQAVIDAVGYANSRNPYGRDVEYWHYRKRTIGNGKVDIDAVVEIKNGKVTSVSFTESNKN